MRWLDNRNPHDSRPLVGTFKDGVGHFCQAIETPGGRPLHVRYTWDEITTSTARWQQDSSFDEGSTGRRAG